MPRTRIAVLLTFVLFVPLTAAQQRGPVQVVKIAAGPAGTESNGVFALSEERSIYRVDVALDARIVWRGFFRVNP